MEQKDFNNNIVVFNEEASQKLMQKSLNPRNRAMNFFNLGPNLTLHGENSPTQMFMNCINKKSYVPPHKHENIYLDEKVVLKNSAENQLTLSEINRWEFFVLIKGKAKVITFDEQGIVSNITYLSQEEGNNNSYSVLIPPNVFHSVVSLEDGTQLFELKNGWYNTKTDKTVASWAPGENQTESEIFRKWLKISEVGQNAREYKTYLTPKKVGINSNMTYVNILLELEGNASSVESTKNLDFLEENSEEYTLYFNVFRPLKKQKLDAEPDSLSSAFESQQNIPVELQNPNLVI